MGCIFGPVPSRRLGRSLGVDLVPFKTCTYDCTYCQLGRTTRKTVRRRPWVPVADILAELEGRLDSRPDYITLSGSGEPTLYSRLGELIDGIRRMTGIPLAVLTNGSLLYRRQVRRQLTDAHVVLPSLDAGSAVMFRAVNRPHPSITFRRMVEGLIAFRREFGGQYWLEVFLLAGLTDADGEVRRIAECVRRIRPDRVQLNTATRPTAEASARRVSRARLAELAAMFDPPAEVIADYRRARTPDGFHAGREGILEMIRRRPCSLGDISEGLGMHRNEVLKHIEALAARGLLTSRRTAGRVFYAARGSSPDPGR